MNEFFDHTTYFMAAPLSGPVRPMPERGPISINQRKGDMVHHLDRRSKPKRVGGHALLAPRGRVLPGRLGPGTGLGSSGTRETLPLLCPSTIRPGEARTDRRKHDCIPPEKARARRQPCTGPITHGAHCPSRRAMQAGLARRRLSLRDIFMSQVSFYLFALMLAVAIKRIKL